jgi:hypothetical protein
MYQSTLLLVAIVALYIGATVADSLEGDRKSQIELFIDIGRGLMSVCYDEYGCFSIGPPFGLTLQRPFALLPDSVRN